MKFIAKSFKIATIAMITSQKFETDSNPAGHRFLVTDNKDNQYWLDFQFVRNLFRQNGLSTKTPFVKLQGTTIKFAEIEITQQMLDDNNGAFTITDPRGIEITYKKTGIRRTDYRLGSFGDKMQDLIDQAGISFVDDWGADTTRETKADRASGMKTIATKAMKAEEVETPADLDEETADEEEEVEAEDKL